MAEIICLANSYKSGGRCVAGIDRDTKAWVRPVSSGTSRAISLATLNQVGLRILDIVDIPLDDSGPSEGCQPENRLVRPGAWRKVGRITRKDLLAYCQDDKLILHNHEDRVPPDFFRDIPEDKWKSLQLVHSHQVLFHLNPWGKWCVCFRYGRGRSLDLKLTDPVALDRLKSGKRLGKNCVLTVSLATPFKRQPNDVPFCWKMVAGVVEL